MSADALALASGESRRFDRLGWATVRGGAGCVGRPRPVPFTTRLSLRRSFAPRCRGFRARSGACPSGPSTVIEPASRSRNAHGRMERAITAALFCALVSARGRFASVISNLRLDQRGRAAPKGVSAWAGRAFSRRFGGVGYLMDPRGRQSNGRVAHVCVEGQVRAERFVRARRRVGLALAPSSGGARGGEDASRSVRASFRVSKRDKVSPTASPKDAVCRASLGAITLTISTDQP